MKTGFIGDIHLGAGRDLGVGEYGEGSRFADQVAVLDRAALAFVAEGCDVVCCLGDVFHTPQPKPWEILAWHGFLGVLAANGIRTITLIGNHDVKSAMLPTALDLAESDWHQVFSRPGIEPQHYGEAVYACLPWTPTSTLVAREGRNENTRERAIDLLVANLRLLRDECTIKYPEATPILLGHWHITGNHLPTGLPTDTLSEPVIPWFEIDAMGWKLAAFGHLHKAGLIAEGQAETRIFHAGSVAVVNLGEIAQEHGVWIYDHDGDELRFVPVEDRPFLDYTFSVDEAKSLCADGEPEEPFDGAVVRIKWRKTPEDHLADVDEAALRRACEMLGAHKVFIKEIDKATTSRARAQDVAENITATDALGLYLDANDVGAARNDADRYVAAIRDRHDGYVERIGNAAV